MALSLTLFILFFKIPYILFFILNCYYYQNTNNCFHKNLLTYDSSKNTKVLRKIRKFWEKNYLKYANIIIFEKGFEDPKNHK